MIEVIKTIKAMRSVSADHRMAGRKIGFVPTMGFLHEGHLSLIRIARDRADRVVVSIFVNPVQFGPEEDLDAYPRNFARDEKLAKQAGADILFCPAVSEIYPEGFSTYVNVERLTEGLCGAFRPGHFRGVATVCTKLFNIIRPDFAVFGQKDAQQIVVIKRMVEDLDLDLEIVVGPIVREPDGLAMSSRNTYLSGSERRDALVLFETLNRAEHLLSTGERNVERIRKQLVEGIASKASARIDYVAVVHPETLQELKYIEDKALIALAVFIGGTRLIDNRMVTL